MTTATLSGPARTAPRPARRSPRATAESAPWEQTLDQMLNGVWSQLSSHTTVACLVCGGTMRPRYGAASGPVGGRCEDCSASIG